jgi:hypothetical protein
MDEDRQALKKVEQWLSVANKTTVATVQGPKAGTGTVTRIERNAEIRDVVIGAEAATKLAQAAAAQARTRRPAQAAAAQARIRRSSSDTKAQSADFSPSGFEVAHQRLLSMPQETITNVLDALTSLAGDSASPAAESESARARRRSSVPDSWSFVRLLSSSSQDMTSTVEEDSEVEKISKKNQLEGEGRKFYF